MNATTSRVATIDDEFDYPLTPEVHARLSRLAAGRACDRVLFVTGARISHGELVDTDRSLVLEFTITPDNEWATTDGVWRPIPEEDCPMLDKSREGTRIALVHTADPYTDLRPGDEGTIRFERWDGFANTIAVAWDRGSGLMLLEGTDSYRCLGD